MKIIPWILVLALLGGAYYLYADNQKLSAQIARLTQDNQAIETLRAENESLKTAAVPSSDAAQIQKDHEDLLRLRSENQMLRRSTNELNGRLGAAQAQTAQAQQTREQLSQVAAENQVLRNRQDLLGQGAVAQTTPEQQAANAAQTRDACVNNLRQIDGAKQQWALENRKLPTDVPTAADISPYLQGSKIPACPGGGTYIIGNLQTAPACNIPSHALQ